MPNSLWRRLYLAYVRRLRCLCNRDPEPLQVENEAPQKDAKLLEVEKLDKILEAAVKSLLED